jgi:hypothetical protein
MEFLIMQLSLGSHHFIPLRSKYFPKYPVLNPISIYALLLRWKTRFHTCTKTDNIIAVYISSYTFKYVDIINTLQIVSTFLFYM